MKNDNFLFSFSISSFPLANVLNFTHNICEYNAQVQFNFCYAIDSSGGACWARFLFALTGGCDFWVLWIDFNYIILYEQIYVQQKSLQLT